MVIQYPAGLEQPPFAQVLGAASAPNMLKLLQAQQQTDVLNSINSLNSNGLGNMMPSDLELALAQIAAQQRQQQAPAAQLNNAGGVNPMLALMQSNPAMFAQALNARQDLAANQQLAALAAQQRAQQQQQQAMVAAQLLQQQAQQAQQRNNLAQQQQLRNMLAAASQNAARTANPMAQAQAQNNAALLNLQQRLMQQQGAQANPAQLMQAAAAQLAAQQAQKQATQAAQQALLKNLMGNAAPQQNQGNAALLKQLQLQDALAKQNEIAASRAQVQAQLQNAGLGGNNNALADLLIRQQALQQAEAQQRAAAAAAANNKAAGPLGGLSQQQLQQLLSNPAGQAFARQVVANGGSLERVVAQLAQTTQQNQQAQQAAAMRAAMPNLANLLNNNGGGMNNGNAGSNNQSMDTAALHALLAQQLQQAKGGNPGSGLNGNLEAAAAKLMGAAGGAAGQAGGANAKDQRRLALACVALQLARSGLSLEQAIESGIMGGMSVVDVRFIQECYAAERARMQQQGVAATGTHGSMGNGPSSSTSSLLGTAGLNLGNMDGAAGGNQSPNGSNAPNNLGGLQMPPGLAALGNIPTNQSLDAALAAAAAAAAAAAHDNTSRATRPGSFGAPTTHGDGFGVPSPRSDQGPRPSTGSIAAGHAGLGIGSMDPVFNRPVSAAPMAPVSQASTTSGGMSVNAALDAITQNSQNFNAFSYDFFGGGKDASGLTEGELLGELEPEGTPAQEASNPAAPAAEPGNAFGEELAWLREAASAHRALLEGPAEDAADLHLGVDDQAALLGSAEGNTTGGGDDLAARLAHLDLGSGFF